MSYFRLPKEFILMLVAVVAGIYFGLAAPEQAVRMRPLGELFTGGVRLLVGPLVFFTVVAGIVTIGRIWLLGQLGLKALLCFETVSTLALVAGLLAGLLLAPGSGLTLPAADAVAAPATASSGLADQTISQAILYAFSHSIILQMLALACLCGTLLSAAGERARRLVGVCQTMAVFLQKVVQVVMHAAPVAAFGAIACATGKYGLGAMTPLLKLLGALYLTSALFILVPLGIMARYAGFRILPFIGYLKEELLLVFGTASSVTAMPGLIAKMERAGCDKAVAGLTIPAGYSFNLVGSNLYLTMAFVFLAQAMQVELSVWQYVSLIAIAMVTSKGASGVAGSAFIALTATVAAMPVVLESSVLLLLGIERLLKCRPLTNVLGNGVACMAIAAWDKRLDRERLRAQQLN